jgi:hypothetical protein
MVAHKNRIVLFGGYYDTGRDMKYYNDVWSLDVGEVRWASHGRMEGGALWPSPRSGCQLALHGDLLFVYGGYSKVRCGGVWGEVSLRGAALVACYCGNGGAW